ncbi:methyltransferase [Vibrio mexicanus]|uniref:methyltransferase n=1 Tax=Vibrio mexicanus TaxID=1004326 RepID=UPI00063CDB64|nr:methyltransferase [Vibrio mexicanus]
MKQQFKILDTFLSDHQDYWRFEPFHQSLFDLLPWHDTHPELCQWLINLLPKEIEHFKSEPAELVAQFQGFLPEVVAVNDICNVEAAEVEDLALPTGLDNGIPGRKLNQIVAMGSAAIGQHQGSEWLEWCSGKGFLGRILAHETQQPVTSFEFQQPLCERGQADADAMKLDMTFVQGDALSDTSRAVFNCNQHAVALHACGDLHVSLISKGVDAQLPAMTLSPCCYHLIQTERYKPMSDVAKASCLSLTKAELRIPLQETVTGGARVHRHRNLEMRFRLGLDLLLRETLGISEYVPVPSIKKSQLDEGFEAFCLWAAEKKGFNLTGVDFQYYLEKAEARFWNMERLSLVQQIFRRPLELWLALDKSLYLEQNGYQVSIKQFCSREVTPRNLLIHAEKTS